jgi:NADPH:quinone reductase-like Zn-dependent oxidoreductase
MKAVRIHHNGGPDVLQYEEAPDPEPGPGEVLVRVRAASVNHRDLRSRRERALPFPYILGTDMAGEVVSAPPGVPFRDGQPVVAYPMTSCGHCRWCRLGQPNGCAQARLVDGGYAEYVAVSPSRLLPVPDGLDLGLAACLPVAYTTAWHMLIGRAALRPGETVLVLGATGGVGSAAVQIAQLTGCRVLATVGSPEKAEQARSLGVEDVLDHTEPFSDEVFRRTSGTGVDVVLEHVGEATWEESIRALAKGGRLVTCGATTGVHGAVQIRELFRRQLTILGSFLGIPAELERVLQLAGEGRLRPVLDRVLPLRGAADAHRLLEQRNHFGKVVLVP